MTASRGLPALPSLEGLRLLASLMVVALHYAGYLGREIAPLHLAVDLFFVVSGIVIAMVYDGRMQGLGDWADFLRKRFARLYPLHLATLLFYVAIGVLAARGLFTPDNPAKYDPANLLPNLLMVHAWSPEGRISYNYVSWSISAEVFVYLAFPLALWAVRRGFGLGLAVVVTVLFAAIAAAELGLGERLTALNWRFGVARAVPGFLFGVWIWEWRDRLRSLPGLARTAPTGFLLAVAAFAAAGVLAPNPYLLLAITWTVVLLAFLADLEGAPTWAAHPALASRGPLTYSLYMLHPVVATLVVSFAFPRLFGRSDPVLWASLAVAAVLTWIAAIVSYRWFETPLRRWIGGRGR